MLKSLDNNDGMEIDGQIVELPEMHWYQYDLGNV